MTEKRTVLITGASSGLGREFARELAACGYGLVLVARRGERLAQLAAELRQQYGVGAEILEADLAQAGQLAAVEARLSDPTAPIDVLVNNAGIALRDRFHRGDIAEEQQMLSLNVVAVMRLTHAAIPGMIARGTGAILNVSSVASFGPVSAGSTYAATKAWVTNFSESLYPVLTSHRVAIVALCPGFVHTEFHSRAGLSEGSQGNFWWLPGQRVARAGVRAVSADAGVLRARRPVVVPTLRYRAVAALIRYLPRWMLRIVSRRRGGL
jgi:hypothetical protein